MERETRSKLENEMGTQVVSSWFESAKGYATRLQIPLDQQADWIDKYVIRQYDNWREYERTSGNETRQRNG